MAGARAQAFKSPDIVAALKLTAEERTQINEIIEQRRPPGLPEKDLELRSTHRLVPPDEAAEIDDRLGRRGPPERRPPRDPGRAGPPDGPDDWRAGPPGHRHDGPPFDGPPEPPPRADNDRQSGDPPRGKPAGRDAGAPPDVLHERQTVEQILAVLTPEQRSTWTNLTGAPFLKNRRGAPKDRPPRLD